MPAGPETQFGRRRNLAEVTRAGDTAVAEEGKPPEYDAFLSYAHRDRQVTGAIQKGLHQIGRPLGQLRALRVFRDDTNLTASPDLWGKITEALDSSRYMIVVLSPQSAGSHWVNEEVSYWLTQRGHRHLMLVLAEGHLQWDAKEARFDPGFSDAAPPALTEPGSLPAEPLYIDVSGDAPWDLRSLTFRDKMTALAAPVHGKAKDQLAGDDLREQRRFRRLRRAAIAALILLTVLAVVAAVIAVAQRQEAIRRLHDAVVSKLNAEGASMLAGATPGGDVRALQELLAAHAIADKPDGVPILNAQVARFTTQKIVDTSSSPRRLAYSPDGSRVVTAQADGTVRVWESTTGKPVGSPIKGHTDAVSAVAFTPDGQRIASAGRDGTMRLWDAHTGAPLNPNPARVAPILSCLAVSPDGSKVVTGGYDGTIRIWDPHGGQLLRTTDKLFTDGQEITDVTYDRTGKRFAASGNGGSVAIGEPGTSHATVITILDGTSSPSDVWRIAFSPDGHTIAAVSEDLQLWNADTGTLIRTIRVGTARSAVVAGVAFSPDGHRVATGRSDGALQLWDADTGAQIGQTLTGHKGQVWDVAFSHDGRQIATTSIDGSLRLWSAAVGQPMRGPDPVLVEVAFSPDGHWVAASGETAIQRWDISSGQPQPPLTPSGAGAKRFGFVEGARIVTTARDGTMQVWDSNTGQPLQPPVHIDIPQGRYFKFAFSRDGHTLASAEEDDGTVQLWDIATGRGIGQPMTVDTAGITVSSLVFSPDGHHLAAGYDDGLRLWNTDTTQLEAAVSTPVTSVAYSRDGNTVASGRVDGAVALWDPHTRQPLPHSPLTGHTSMVSAVAFGVGHQMATAGWDESLRLWDSSTGAPTAAALTRSDLVESVAISPDGRLAASASLDGTMLLSPAIADLTQLCDKLASNMSRKQWRDWVSPDIPYITVCPGLPIAPD
jgi:WD40 repeat protein